MPLRVFNSLKKAVEPFVPADPSHVTFYTCGPTVYDDAHIGNFRSFLAADVLRRWLESPLCELSDGKGGVHRGPRKVTHVMNITDVGHMTDDAEGGEAGEDRMAVAGRRLAEAKKSGKIPAGVRVDPSDPYQIARFYEERFKDDARRLGLKLVLDADKDPTLMPRATASVPGMIEVIARLIARGNAYVAGPPGSRVVYFSVQTFPAYGRLSGNTLDKLREGAGGRVSGLNQAQKRHPADFLLWKEDPSHIMKWDSPWGAGYPGWHIECTVMSVGRLRGIGLPPDAEVLGGALPSRTASGGSPMPRLLVPDAEPIIDIHSGGEDNIFPHHECEIAQTCCAFNEDPKDAPFARLWFHPRFLLVEGTKMSKSKGNFYTARDLFAKGIEPAAVRLEIIRTHYRSNANFTMQGLADSQRTIERWRKARFEIARRSFGWDRPNRTLVNHIPLVQSLFGAVMDEDVNVAGLIARVNERLDALAKVPCDESQVSKMTDAQIEAAWRESPELARVGPPLDPLFFVEPVLGVLSLPRLETAATSIGLFMDGLAPDPAVVAKLEDRRAARAAKDFKRSDAIRDELAAMGYAIKDVAGGKVEVRRK